MLILLVSFYMAFSNQSEIEEEVREIKIGSVEEETPDIEESVNDYLEEKDLVLKSINYPIMNFFRSVNNGDFEFEVFPEYKEFFSLSESINKEYYKEFDNLFYEITSYDKNNGKYLVDVRFTDDSINVIDKVFTTDGNYVIDEAFLKVEDIDNIVEDEDYLIVVEKRLVYKDREVFRIRVENKTSNSINIDYGMYGFYAIDELNRYYHKLLEGSSNYKILPKSEGLYFVEFSGKNNKDIYMEIGEKELMIYSKDPS